MGAIDLLRNPLPGLDGAEPSRDATDLAEYARRFGVTAPAARDESVAGVRPSFDF